MKRKRRILAASLGPSLSTFFICLTSATPFAAAPQPKWTETMGGATYSSASGSSVAVDGSGNVYVTGMYCRTVDFDPGAGEDNHTSVGNNDIFLTRINADGSYAWTKTMDGTAL